MIFLGAMAYVGIEPASTCTLRLLSSKGTLFGMGTL